MPTFISLNKSSRDKKKYVIRLDNPKQTIHFGSKNSQTYLDHKDKQKRKNYLARHIVNERWDKINAGSLSAGLLWGKHTSLDKNLDDYLRRFNITR